MSLWPYKASFVDTGKRVGVLVMGVIFGCKIVTTIYNPTKEYEEKLNEGKKALLLKYRNIHEERMKRLGHVDKQS
uniref:ATP synthase subunit e, mitochondrial n=1 Tax=Parastrongyloides trichosuri TaxID=131310 RepID=A0A0N4ZYN4_PARTI